MSFEVNGRKVELVVFRFFYVWNRKFIRINYNRNNNSYYVLNIYFMSSIVFSILRVFII